MECLIVWKCTAMGDYPGSGVRHRNAGRSSQRRAELTLRRPRSGFEPDPARRLSRDGSRSAVCGQADKERATLPGDGTRQPSPVTSVQEAPECLKVDSQPRRIQRAT